MAKKKMSPLWLLIVAVGAYLALRPKKAAAAEPAAWSPPDFTPTGLTSGVWNTGVEIPYRPSWQ